MIEEFASHGSNNGNTKELNDSEEENEVELKAKPDSSSSLKPLITTNKNYLQPAATEKEKKHNNITANNTATTTKPSINNHKTNHSSPAKAGPKNTIKATTAITTTVKTEDVIGNNTIIPTAAAASPPAATTAKDRKIAEKTKVKQQYEAYMQLKKKYIDHDEHKVISDYEQLNDDIQNVISSIQQSSTTTVSGTGNNKIKA